MSFFKKIFHYGDMIAIPFFIILFVYFYKKHTRTPIETLLMVFSMSALIVDIIFTIMFLYN